MFILFGVEMLLLFVVIYLGRGKYTELFASIPYKFKLPAAAVGAMYALEHLRLMKYLDFITVKAHEKIIVIHGNKHARELTQFFTADTLITSYMCLLVGTLLGAVSEGDVSLLGIGLLFMLLIPVLSLKGLTTEMERRKRSIVLDLPEVLNKIILLINAGETAQGAFVRVIKGMQVEEKRPLIEQLQLTALELQMGVSFAKALENLSRRSSVSEVSLFTTTLMLNHKRGGDELVTALRGLAKELWDRRKAVCRTLGEEASSKLLFPMVLIFVIVMVIVGAPAIMVMNS
ncbi:type II secretion system F family protein [Paenibacillus radicibacter]|uniref:type II secretion system F family protein n=1 Tax=Paenibacillus radicibacter TaxID=2972488 RepID=UPI0021593649|nr:type II secretion system F family protein [Paenibacillus radicibacter]